MEHWFRVSDSLNEPVRAAVSADSIPAARFLLEPLWNPNFAGVLPVFILVFFGDEYQPKTHRPARRRLHWTTNLNFLFGRNEVARHRQKTMTFDA